MLADVTLVRLPAVCVGVVTAGVDSAVPAMVGATLKLTAVAAVGPFSVVTFAEVVLMLARYCVPTFGGVVADMMGLLCGVWVYLF